MTPHPLLGSVLSDARFPPRLFLLVQKLAHLLTKRQTDREDGWEEPENKQSSQLFRTHFTLSLERGSAEKQLTTPSFSLTFFKLNFPFCSGSLSCLEAKEILEKQWKGPRTPVSSHVPLDPGRAAHGRQQKKGAQHTDRLSLLCGGPAAGLALLL